MELSEFLLETQAEVRAQMSDGSPFAEIVFSEVVMQHMAEIGMTFEPVVCLISSTPSLSRMPSPSVTSSRGASGAGPQIGRAHV